MLVYQVSVNENQELFLGIKYPKISLDFPRINSALEEDPGRSIRIDDYIDLLKRSGWEITHIIDCPLSTQRFQANIVSQMQKNRILGVVRRSLIMGRKK